MFRLELGFFSGASIKECLVYSTFMRISYVVILCFSVALFAPWIINTQMSFAPKDPRVAGRKKSFYYSEILLASLTNNTRLPLIIVLM